MTTLIFEQPIEIAKLTDVLKKLDEVTPDTSLIVELKDNSFVTKITISPAVSSDRVVDLTKLAEEIGAKLEL